MVWGDAGYFMVTLPFYLLYIPTRSAFFQQNVVVFYLFVFEYVMFSFCLDKNEKRKTF
jgi:hypothetical protein